MEQPFSREMVSLGTGDRLGCALGALASVSGVLCTGFIAWCVHSTGSIALARPAKALLTRAGPIPPAMCTQAAAGDQRNGVTGVAGRP
ncbi:hypothetical protein ABC304_17615 [Microbacterium sp. 1P10UB]|uniref:hypothetical protein n=1 Tax=unclassified Microbacterium TaxID=2609290 RepID=UPI0039A00F25